MDTEFLVQMMQSDKCGSVRNDDIFNLHLIVKNLRKAVNNEKNHGVLLIIKYQRNETTKPSYYI